MARYDLRLSEDEFWRSTLYELNLLMERFSADMKFRAACAGAKIEDADEKPSLEAQYNSFFLYSQAHNANVARYGVVQNPNQAAR